MPPQERLHEGVGFLRRREGAGNSGMTTGGRMLRSGATPPCGGAGEDSCAFWVGGNPLRGAVAEEFGFFWGGGAPPLNVL